MATGTPTASFELGEQPEWAGTEECTSKDPSFIASLLDEDVYSQIINRGYAVMELEEDVSQLYSNFHSAFEAFSQLPIEQKQKFASKQFEAASHSPNQFHGFSVVGGLKEQFMMRLSGTGTSLITPGKITPATEDLGVVGMRLYERLDELCRETARGVLEQIGRPSAHAETLLDPINQTRQPVLRDPTNPDICYSSYVLPGYISSSIMDNFHYYNTFTKEEQNDEKFFNNHAAHTDSGLLTVVVVTDIPGLEVFDQRLQEWIALEQLLHQYVPTIKRSHRKFATIFWGDSVSYLKAPLLKPCMHRVGKSSKERYSVVFKQRTSPLTTAPRYQEDYLLASIQLDAVNKSKSPAFDSRLIVIGATAVAAVAAVVYLRIKQLW